MTRERPTQDQIVAWYRSLSNWGRWGEEDQRGTLNLITPDIRAAAASLVRDGITVSCGRPISYEPATDAIFPTLHFMLRTPAPEPTAAASIGRFVATDAFMFAPHGFTLTHLDAPSHTAWRSDPSAPIQLYNGLPGSAVTSQGAAVGAIDVAGDGIVSRGVLLDIAAALGVPWLEPGTEIYPEDLDAAATGERVTVQGGDILLVRTGHPGRRRELGPVEPRTKCAGLQAACLPWLREKDVAVLCSDTATDVGPAQYPEIGHAVHGVGMAAMGLWILDNADLEALATYCRRAGRYEFMLTIAPLKWADATASPVNPIAIF